MAVKLALVAEEFEGNIVGFKTTEEADAFAAGFARAGQFYGAGNCRAFTEEEIVEEIDMYNNQGPLEEYEQERLDMLQEMRRTMKELDSVDVL